jgi:membrane protein
LNKFLNYIKILIRKVFKRPNSREILFILNKNIFLKKIELIFREAIFILKNSKFSEKSAQLSYISILSLVPLIAVIFTFIHAFNGFNNFLNEVISPIITKHFGNRAGSEILSYLQSIISNLQLKELGVISFLTFLFTVILLILKIEDTIDEIMEFKNKSNILNRLAKCWLIITITPFLFALASIKSDSFINFTKINDHFFLNSHSIKIFRFSIGILFQWVFFIIIFYAIPSKKINFKSALFGGIIANFLFEILQFVNVHIAKRALATDPSHIYGSVPIIAVLFFVWIRLIWITILTGSSFTIATQKILFFKKNSKFNIFPSKGIVDCLKIYKTIRNLYRYQNIPSSESYITKVTDINPIDVEIWLDYLIKKNIICSSDHEQKNPHYLPSYLAITKDQGNIDFLKKIILDDILINSTEYHEIIDIFNKNQS